MYLDTRIEEDQRQKYLTYMGEVFEDYVHRLFDRIYPPKSRRYLHLDELWQGIATKDCDGLLIYENCLILIECKASLFNLEARVGHDFSSISGRLKDIYLDGAIQLQATINKLRQGFRDKNETIPENALLYILVIVTLEHIPMHPIINREIQKMLSSMDYLMSMTFYSYSQLTLTNLSKLKPFCRVGSHSVNLSKTRSPRM